VIVLGDYAGWLVGFGETGRARPILEESLTLAAGRRGRWLSAAALVGLALIDAIEGEGAAAARRLGAVDALAQEGGLFVPPQYQMRIDRATELATAALGPRRFATLWEAGRADPWAVAAEGMTGAASPVGALGLTDRELQVLRLLADGQSDKEIGAALGISSRTVSHHLASVLAKLGVRSRGEAAVRAVRDGLA
jgi:DNA-binding NarL/FixJ family response regulator